MSQQYHQVSLLSEDPVEPYYLTPWLTDVSNVNLENELRRKKTLNASSFAGHSWELLSLYSFVVVRVGSYKTSPTESS